MERSPFRRGASDRNRTNDTGIFSPLLYQLSYRGVWSGLRGSNSLPPPWQGGALPDELKPLMVGMTGFEPAASCSQSRRATELRYIPSLISLSGRSDPKAQIKRTAAPFAQSSRAAPRQRAAGPLGCASRAPPRCIRHRRRSASPTELRYIPLAGGRPRPVVLRTAPHPVTNRRETPCDTAARQGAFAIITDSSPRVNAEGRIFLIFRAGFIPAVGPRSPRRPG